MPLTLFFFFYTEYRQNTESWLSCSSYTCKYSLPFYLLLLWVYLPSAIIAMLIMAFGKRFLKYNYLFLVVDISQYYPPSS